MASIRLATGESIDTPKWHKQRMASLEEMRQPFLSTWHDLQRYILPRLGRQFKARGQSKHKPTDTRDIIDTTGTQAHSITSAGMMAGITSPARRWLKMAAREGSVGAGVPGEFTEWLQYADDQLFAFWDETDLYDMLAGVYDELLLFGTAAGYGTPVPGAERGKDFIWRMIPGGEYVVGEDANGNVNSLYRARELTVEQVVSRFAPRDSSGRPQLDGPQFSSQVRHGWENGKWDDTVKIIQFIGRSPRVETYLGNEPPYEEVVFLAENAGQDHIEGAYLSRTSFNVMPSFCGRWEKNGVSPWGMSPGMEALPDVKQLQEMEEKKAAALTLHINPPLQGPPELQNTRVTSLPGDVNYVAGLSSGGKGLVPVYQVQPRLADFAADMELVRSRVRRSFHSDLFLAFIERPGIQPLNESEIWERKEEKLLGLGQVMDRLDREIIRPIVEISLDFLISNERMDAPPEGLEDYDIEYLNVIAVAQRTQGLTAISDTVSFVATMAQQQAAAGLSPTAWDYLNEGEAIQGFAKRRGVDMRVLRDEDEVEELQEQRAQAQAQMAELEAQQQQAATAKDQAAAEELASRTARDQGPLATGGGPGVLPADVGAGAP